MRQINRIGFIILMMGLLLSVKSLANSKSLEGVIKYTPLKDRQSVYGLLNCKGSTNVENFLKIWVPQFQLIYPNVKSSFDFKGSGDGIDALMNDRANIGASSRPIKQKEIEAFKNLKGYAPTEIKVSLDALAIYVNRLNRLETITLEELDAIFSSDRKRGYPEAINSWVSLTDTTNKINIYLFDSNSGTRSYFRKQVMLKGDYNQKNIVSDKYTKTSEVVGEVAKDIDGICFGSVGVTNFKVKTLSLSKRKNYPTYYPSSKDIKNGNYPLTRFFYIYLDVPPDKPIPKLLYEFCKFVLSHKGQETVIREEGLSLSPKQIGIELAKMRRE